MVKKSRSISSSRSSTNNYGSKCSTTSESSSASSTTISHSSADSSSRADFFGINNVESSPASRYVIKQSPLISSKPRLSQSDQSSNQTKIKSSYIDTSLQPKPSPRLLHANFCINDTVSTIASSTSSSIGSSGEIASKNMIYHKEDKHEEDPLYSDPLDALEKETDTRIYHSPALKNHEDPIENVYEEAPNDKWRTENMPLQ